MELKFCNQLDIECNIKIYKSLKKQIDNAREDNYIISGVTKDMLDTGNLSLDFYLYKYNKCLKKTLNKEECIVNARKECVDVAREKLIKDMEKLIKHMGKYN